MARPLIKLSPLGHADGSITYSHSGYTVLATVNGPVEVQRKDEIPEEAAIEVNIRPVSGAGALKEKQLEADVQNVMRRVIKVEELPRTRIQVTLQVLQEPQGTPSRLNVSSSLPLIILPCLLQASTAAFLASALPMRFVPTTILVAASKDNSFLVDPSPQDFKSVSSLHIFTLTNAKHNILAQSAGAFDLSTWKEALSVAEHICCEDEKQAHHTGCEKIETYRVIYSDLWREMVLGITNKHQRWKQQT